jgi:acyl dehydratase
MGLIGKQYDGGIHLIEREAMEAYALATDDPNPAYRGEHAVAPPMFHVRPMWPLLEMLAADPELELDRLRLVHGEHAMTFHRPLHAGDRLALGASLLSLQDKPSGRVATFELRGHIEGDLALQGNTTYFIRPARRDDTPKAHKDPKPQVPAPEPDPTFVVSQHVPLDMPARYADASGDHNPIHLDDEVAKKAGLPGVILHGLCTMALAQRDLVARLCGGDPLRLHALSVRFARPVRPGEDLRLEVLQREGESHFTTRNSRGEAVITHGRATVS